MTLNEIFLPYQYRFFHARQRRKIWVASRQVGKSFTLAGILVYRALSKKRGLSLCISTGSRAASEIIGKCAQFAEAVKTMTDGKIDYDASFDSIRFSNGCRVLSLPSSTDGSNLRGWSAQCVVIDEAAFIPHLDEILQAINPTLSRDQSSELILASTPAGRNGAFYRLWKYALEDDDVWHAQTTTIHDAIKDGLKVSLESLKQLCPDADAFGQEYECRFSKEFDSFIPDAEDLQFFDEDAEELDSGKYFSADIGRTNDRTVILTGSRKGDDVYVEDLVVMKNAEYQLQLDTMKALNDRHRFRGGYVDSTGIGSAVAEFANRKISTLIRPFVFSEKSKNESYERIRDFVFQRHLKFNRKFEEQIKNDFRMVRRIVTEDGKVRFEAERGPDGHGDIVSSLAMLVSCMTRNPARDAKPFSFKRGSIF